MLRDKDGTLFQGYELRTATGAPAAGRWARVIDLQGGLGNQLFQYAAGRAMGSACATPLALDLRLLRRDSKRTYALAPLHPHAAVVDSSLLSPPGRLRRWAAAAGWRTGAMRLYPFGAPCYEERAEAGNWDPAVVQQQPPVVLRGYFQSPRYFESIAPELHAEWPQA